MKILLTGASGFIGTSLVEYLLSNKKNDFINIDIKAPIKNEYSKYWKKCSLLDKDKLENIIKEYSPTHCIHLAAETKMKELGDITKNYPVNIYGSENLFKLLKKYNIKKTVIISTQYVCGPSNKLPEKNDDYWPHTNYGKSKVLMEKCARDILENNTFVIARPTYIWGPWNFKNFNELIYSIVKRKYIHPSGEPIIRSYGYVKNICFQLVKLLELSTLEDSFYYVGDTPINSYTFVNTLSKGLTGKNVHSLPKFIILILAKIGDIIKKLPINSFRYKNMTNSYLTPMEKTFSEIGESPFSLNEAVKDYVKWYNSYFRNK